MLSCGMVKGATIVGTISQTYDDNNIVFTPKSTPWANGYSIVTASSQRVASSNLTFSVKLTGGVYLTSFSSGNNVYIYVPPNDTNTYQFTFVATNLLSLAMLNNPRLPSTLFSAGVNVTLITNNVGLLSESITINTYQTNNAYSTNSGGSSSFVLHSNNTPPSPGAGEIGLWPSNNVLYLVFP